MHNRIFTSTIAALALFAVVGLVAALAPSITSLNLARAHSPGSATLTALTVTVDGTAQTLTPAFSSTVTDYTVAVADTVTQITIEGTADGDGTVAYQNTDGTTLTDADTVVDGQQVDLPAGDDKRINVVVSHTDSGTTTTQTYGVLVSREGTDDSCDGGGYNPTPTAVAVDVVPIVVESTTDDYFVLYVQHELDEDTMVELPVLVKRGEASTTTLAENVAALPVERYRVEKYLIAEPADVDGDCIDDLTELDNLGNMNPVNPATAIELNDGAVTVPDQETFETLSYEYSGKMFIKFILLDTDTDTDRPRIYFTNVKTHAAHNYFLDAVGTDRSGQVLGEGLVYGTIEYDSDGSPGSFYYWLRPSNTYYSVARMVYFYTLLAASMPLLENNLAVHMGNSQLRFLQPNLALYSESRIPLVFDEDIYPETSFLALNPGEGYGLLRVMEPKERPNPRDIVIYEALPNELPRVAGVISTVPQTPLTHVNLRAVQDRIPNAFIRDGLNKVRIASLRGKYVHYTVTKNGWDLKAASRAEVDDHYAASRPAREQTPQRDLSVTSITPLSEIGFGDWRAFGVKAANVAVLRTLGFPAGTVPNGFAIPFYFYDEFMKHNDFYTRIETMLADPDFQDDYDTQEDKLKKLRKDIKDAETPELILTALEEMNEGFPDGINRRYRSSTNNEDLPGFNGAGLYDSKSQKPSEDEEDLAKSLKEVYASLWNYRAFIERDFHRVDHLKTAMGILVHPSYQDELANGVAVSMNPPTGETDDYYVNTQLGEDLVTNPEAHSVPEEILLRQNRYTVLATSNLVEPGRLLMSDDQLNQLREHLTTIHDHFKRLYNPAAGKPFAMEIEFKITSDDVLAIKQARPWVFGVASAVLPNRAPVFTEGASAYRIVAETTASGVNIGTPVAASDPDRDALTYSLSGADADSFDIVSGTGQLQTKTALDYESKSSYSVTVSVRDSKDGEGNPDTTTDSTIAVTILVTEVNEAPVFPSATATRTISENTPAGRNIGAPVAATDPDSDALTYSLNGADAGSFDIVSGTGQLQTKASLDGASGNSYSVTVSVRDSKDDEGNPDTTTDSTIAVTILVTEVNEVPVFPSATATRTIPETTTAGVNIGAPVAATDPNSGDTLTYSLGGTDADSFDIISISGQLQTKTALDYESKSSYSVTVSVRDSKDADGNPDTTTDSTIAVTILVTTVTTTTTTTTGGGGGGGGRSRATPTPTPTPSPTPTATPTPTGPQFSGLIAAEPSVTGMVVPEGITLGLNGGADLPGGVYVNFPPTAVALPVHVSVSVSNEAPSNVVAPSGTTLLPLTINITPETPLILGEPLTIEINPTPEQLAAAGGDLNKLAVGVVTPHGIVVLPAQVMHGRLVVTTDRIAPFVLLAVTDTGPTLTQPPMGDASSMGPLLKWTQPPGTTWFQVQVIPFNEDGPGINLVIGDGAQVQAAQYQVRGPNFGSADPNYVMLPGMTYLWRVRTTTVLTNPTEADWSAWAVSSFKTPPASSSTITPVAPPAFGEVSTLTPTLTWANSNTAVFYYEVQVSKDYEFGPNAFLYSEYVHGGASTPPNSYVVPAAFPLEAGEIYYWRVRPRIQGDGDPLPWSTTYVFLAPG